MLKDIDNFKIRFNDGSKSSYKKYKELCVEDDSMISFNKKFNSKREVIEWINNHNNDCSRFDEIVEVQFSDKQIVYT
jgi:hypothetical protein